jgi:hypothetical protein
MATKTVEVGRDKTPMQVTGWRDDKGVVHYTDPGWSYNPGVGAAKKLDDLIIEKANRLVIGCDGDVFSEEKPGCAALKALRDSLLNEGKTIAKTAKFKYNENEIGESFTIPFADKKTPPKVKAAREEVLQKFMDTLEAGGIPEGKTPHYKYIHSSIYGMMEENYAGVIQLGKNGEVLAAGGIDAILSDSVHLNTLGSLGMGAGKKVTLSVMEYSRDTAKRKGNVTLFSDSNPKTILWYEENDEEYAARMAAQKIADTAHRERTKNEPDLDEEFGIYGGVLPDGYLDNLD